LLWEKKLTNDQYATFKSASGDHHSIEFRPSSEIMKGTCHQWQQIGFNEENGSCKSVQKLWFEGIFLTEKSRTGGMLNYIYDVAKYERK